MARNKKSEIPHYELLYIVSNKYTEDEVKPIIKNVNKIITDKQGKITLEEAWGKKKLAYKVEHFNHGYYNLVEFDVAGEEVQNIDKALRMSREVLRHQIVTKRVKTEADIRKEKQVVARKVEKEVEKKKEEDKEKLDKERDKSKVNLKDLDEKLDKILDTDDLF